MEQHGFAIWKYKQFENTCVTGFMTDWMWHLTTKVVAQLPQPVAASFTNIDWVLRYHSQLILEG